MLLKFQQVIFRHNGLFFDTTSCFSKQRVVFRNNRLFYLSNFLKGFEKLDFAVKVNSTDCFDKTIDCFSDKLNRILLSGFNMF